MKKVIKLTESQLKKITEMVISEQGAMDDILNNSPNAPTYNAGTPTANSPKPTYGAPPPPKAQQTSDYFSVIERFGWELIPNKFKDPNARDTKWSDTMTMTIYTNGRVNLWTNAGDFNPRYMGTIKIIGNDSFKIMFDNGQVYDSKTNTTSAAGEESKENLYVNCASSLDEIKEGSVKILKYGCKTDAVKELQKLLGMEEKYQTGYFGPITKGKVKEYQTSKNLKSDGIVGYKTYTALTSETDTDATDNEQKQNVDEYYDDIEDDYNDKSDNDHNELDSLFNTEYDYDGETLRGDESGFSNKLRQNQINKSIKLGDTNIESGRYLTKDRKKDRENEKRKYAGLDLLRNDSQPKPYSPIKSDDLPLDKYLEKKKMKNLDEDEDIAMLDNLFKKD